MTEEEYRPLGTPFLRTDVRYMSRRDLFASAVQFLLAGVLGIGLMWLLSLAGRDLPEFALAVGAFGLVILSGMGFAGAVYLFVRACFRSPHYDPREVWLADELGVDRAEQEEHRS